MKFSWMWRGVAAALLAAWLAGLAFAAVRLGSWQRELVHTLLQMRADRALRVRMTARHEPIPREWYRSKALALLAAADRLQDDSGWSLVLPGSWRGVDNLRDRLAQRIEREFADIAVETVRRELDFRASELTGVPLQEGSGELLMNAGCADPLLPAAASSFQDVPELQAVQSHLDAIEQLDRAVQALAKLQSRGSTDVPAFRLLVRYTLGAELPQASSLRSAGWFRHVLEPADPARQAVRIARLQAAVRCSLGKRMAALDARLFERSDLLQAEAALSRQTAALLRPAGVPPAAASTLDGWRNVVALIGREEDLLGQGDNGWMKEGSSLGQVHEAVLARVGRIGLLGADAQQHLRRDSGVASQHLRRQFAAILQRGGDPAMEWHEGEGRFALAPQRRALRDALSVLLREPLMSTPREHPWPEAAGALRWDDQRLGQVLALAGSHQRAVADTLPKFPAAFRPAMARLMNAQFAQQVEDGVVEAVAPGHEASTPVDVLAWHAGRQTAAQVQSLLARLGARAGAERVRRLLAGDVAARLSASERVWAGSIFASPRLQDFGWWQGEGSPILRALAVGDALTLRYVLEQQVRQLDDAVRRVAPVLQEARDSEPQPAVLRWRSIAGALERAHAGHPDNSLSAMVRTLLVAGPQLQGSTCADQLAGMAAPRGGVDEFARRHRTMLDALARRCRELRSAPRRPQEVPIPAAYTR